MLISVLFNIDKDDSLMGQNLAEDLRQLSLPAVIVVGQGDDINTKNVSLLSTSFHASNRDALPYHYLPRSLLNIPCSGLTNNGYITHPPSNFLRGVEEFEFLLVVRFS